MILVRHAPVDAEGICYGRHEVPTLIPAPVSARQVLERLEEPPSRIWSSPLQRCSELAGHMAYVLDIEHRRDVRLSELDYGSWEGRAWSEIEGTDPVTYGTWMENWIFQRAPGGECARDVSARVEEWLRETALGTNDLVVTHAGVIRALWVLRRGWPWPRAMAQRVEHLVPKRLA